MHAVATLFLDTAERPLVADVDAARAADCGTGRQARGQGAEPGRNRVGDVGAPAIDTTREPLLHHHNDIVVHLGNGIVEDESAVTLERLVFRLRTPIPAVGLSPAPDRLGSSSVLPLGELHQCLDAGDDGCPPNVEGSLRVRRHSRTETWTHQAHMNDHDAILAVRATGRSRQPLLCTFEAGQLRSRRTCP